jgi:hypothetical protein
MPQNHINVGAIGRKMASVKMFILSKVTVPATPLRKLPVTTERERIQEIDRADHDEVTRGKRVTFRTDDVDKVSGEYHDSN